MTLIGLSLAELMPTGLTQIEAFVHPILDLHDSEWGQALLGRSSAHPRPIYSTDPHSIAIDSSFSLLTASRIG